jgi:hypothetical protein
MYIEKLEINGIEFDEFSITFDKNTNIIVGYNSHYKTNLLKIIDSMFNNNNNFDYLHSKLTLIIEKKDQLYTDIINIIKMIYIYFNYYENIKNQNNFNISEKFEKINLVKNLDFIKIIIEKRIINNKETLCNLYINIDKNNENDKKNININRYLYEYNNGDIIKLLENFIDINYEEYNKKMKKFENKISDFEYDLTIKDILDKYISNNNYNTNNHKYYKDIHKIYNILNNDDTQIHFNLSRYLFMTNIFDISNRIYMTFINNTKIINFKNEQYFSKLDDYDNIKKIFKYITGCEFYIKSDIMIYNNDNENYYAADNYQLELIKLLYIIFTNESKIIIIDQICENLTYNNWNNLFNYLIKYNKQIIVNTNRIDIIQEKYIKDIIVLNNTKNNKIIYDNYFSDLSENRNKLHLFICNSYLFSYKNIIFVEGKHEYIFLSAFKDFLYHLTNDPICNQICIVPIHGKSKIDIYKNIKNIKGFNCKYIFDNDILFKNNDDYVYEGDEGDEELFIKIIPKIINFKQVFSLSILCGTEEKIFEHVNKNNKYDKIRKIIEYYDCKKNNKVNKVKFIIKINDKNSNNIDKDGLNRCRNIFNDINISTNKINKNDIMDYLLKKTNNKLIIWDNNNFNCGTIEYFGHRLINKFGSKNNWKNIRENDIFDNLVNKLANIKNIDDLINEYNKIYIKIKNDLESILKKQIDNYKDILNDYEKIINDHKQKNINIFKSDYNKSDFDHKINNLINNIRKNNDKYKDKYKDKINDINKKISHLLKNKLFDNFDNLLYYLNADKIIDYEKNDDKYVFKIKDYNKKYNTIFNIHSDDEYEYFKKILIKISEFLMNW